MYDAAERAGTAGTLKGRWSSTCGMGLSYPEAQTFASLFFVNAVYLEELLA